MKKKKINVKSNTIKFRDPYGLIEQAVENGVAYGWSRGWKHREDPQPERADELRDEIIRAVMTEICELLKFDNES